MRIALKIGLRAIKASVGRVSVITIDWIVNPESAESHYLSW